MLILAGLSFASMFLWMFFRLRKSKPERKLIYERFVKSKIKSDNTI
jgi:hypothetical protein